MDWGTVLVVLLLLSLVVASIVELVKRLVLQPLDAKYQWTREKYVMITTLVALVTAFMVVILAWWGIHTTPLLPESASTDSGLLLALMVAPVLVYLNLFWHEALDYSRTKVEQQKVKLIMSVPPPSAIVPDQTPS